MRLQMFLHQLCLRCCLSHLLEVNHAHYPHHQSNKPNWISMSALIDTHKLTQDTQSCHPPMQSICRAMILPWKNPLGTLRHPLRGMHQPRVNGATAISPKPCPRYCRGCCIAAVVTPGPHVWAGLLPLPSSPRSMCRFLSLLHS